MAGILVKTYRGYSIVKNGSDLIAVDHALGPLCLYEELVGKREIGTSILRSSNIDLLTAKIDQAIDPIVYGEPAHPLYRTLDGVLRRLFGMKPAAIKQTSTPQAVSAAPRTDNPSIVALRQQGPMPNVDDDFLQYTFHHDIEAIAAALVHSLGNRPQTLRLIGSSAFVDDLATALLKYDFSAVRVPWSFAEPPRKELEGILCEIPKTFDEWYICQTIVTGGRVKPIWQLILKWGPLRELLAHYEYNSPTFEEMIKVYSGRSPEEIGNRFTANAQIDRLQQHFPLRGKTIIEFGPSDGNRTADLVAAGAEHVLGIEGRHENVVKLLVAKHVMDWRNVDVVLDNFQLPGEWASKRYDLAYADGTHYHTQHPMMFLDMMTQVSNTIFIGGWAATDEKPTSEWLTLEYEGIKYRAKMYHEPYHFLSGLALESYIPEASEVVRFLEGRGFAIKYCDHIERKHDLGKDWIELLATKA